MGAERSLPAARLSPPSGAPPRSDHPGVWLLPPCAALLVAARPAAELVVEGHGHYHRHAADRPCFDRRFLLVVRLRRCRCRNPACPRRTFSQRPEGLLARCAQRTRRSANVQAAVGVALRGEAGARLLDQLGMAASATTVLRLVRALPLIPSASTVAVPTGVRTVGSLGRGARVVGGVGGADRTWRSHAPVTRINAAATVVARVRGRRRSTPRSFFVAMDG